MVVEVGPDAPVPATRITQSGPTAVLHPPGGEGPPQGLATTFLRQPGNRVIVHFRSSSLARGIYGVWLVELHQKPHFVGYSPQTFPSGSMEFEAPLTVNVHRPNPSPRSAFRSITGGASPPGEAIGAASAGGAG